MHLKRHIIYDNSTVFWYSHFVRLMKRKLKLFFVFGLASLVFINLALSSLFHLSYGRVSAAAGDGIAATYGVTVNNGRPEITLSNIRSAEWIDAAHLLLTFQNDLTATFVPVNDANNGNPALLDQRLLSASGEGVVTYESRDIGCYARIEWDLNEDRSDADFVTTRLGEGRLDIDFRPDSASSCRDSEEFNITPTNTDLSIAYFRWVDSGTIVTADGQGAGTFRRASEPGSNFFVRESEAGASSCIDKALVDPNTNTITWWELDSSNSQFGGNPPDSANTEDECEYRTSMNSGSVESGFPPSNVSLPLGGTEAQRTAAPGTGTTGLTGDALGSSGGDQNPTCETSSTSPVTWFICPILNGALDSADWLFRVIIEPFLRISPITTDSDDKIFQIWTSFRTLGNIVLIFGLLFVVFGQSIGGGVVDAYTAKKALPRILVAAVLINLSIYIAAVLVDIFNILGMGIGQLITSPLRGSGDVSGSFNFQPFSSGSSGFLVNGGLLLGTVGLGSVWVLRLIENARNTGATRAGGTGGGGTGGGGIIGAGGSFMPFLLLFIVLPIVVAVIGIFVTLILRRGIIVLCVIIAPIALALYCLPSTEKYTKKWLDLFVKALMVYPIIIAFFAIGDVLSTVLFEANEGNILGELVAVIVLFIPLFMIPFAFKFAGSAIGTIYGALNGVGKKGSEMIKGSEHNPHSARNRAKANAMEGVTRYQARAVKGGDALNASRSRRMVGRFASKFGNVDARLSQLNADSAKSMEQLSATGDDTLLYAAMGWQQGETEYNSDGSVKFKADSYYSAKLDDNGKHKEISDLEFKRGKKFYGSGIADIGNVLRYRLGKAQTDADVGAMRTAVEKNAIADNWTDGELKGVWAAATYPHKDKLPSEWYSTPSVIKNSSGKTTGVVFKDISQSEASYGKFMNDNHKAREQYKLSSLRDGEWRAMYEHQEKIETKLDAGDDLTEEEATNYAMTSELMDAMVQTRFATQDPSSGDVVASGTSAASQKIITAMYKNRRYTAKAAPTSTGTESADERYIERLGTATTPPAAVTGRIVGAGGARGSTVRVTGDSERSAILK